MDEIVQPAADHLAAALEPEHLEEGIVAQRRRHAGTIDGAEGLEGGVQQQSYEGLAVADLGFRLGTVRVVEIVRHALFLRTAARLLLSETLCSS